MDKFPPKPIERILGDFNDGFESEDIVHTALQGLKVALEGWVATLPANALDKELIDREALFHKWTKETETFFQALKNSRWDCCLEVGKSEVRGHALRPLGQGHAIYEQIDLHPGRLYMLDFFDMRLVAPDSNYDLPVPGFSDYRQLYLGDTKKQVAISLNQLAYSLVDGGDLKLATKRF